MRKDSKKQNIKALDAFIRKNAHKGSAWIVENSELKNRQQIAAYCSRNGIKIGKPGHWSQEEINNLIALHEIHGADGEEPKTIFEIAEMTGRSKYSLDLIRIKVKKENGVVLKWKRKASEKRSKESYKTKTKRKNFKWTEEVKTFIEENKTMGVHWIQEKLNEKFNANLSVDAIRNQCKWDRWDIDLARIVSEKEIENYISEGKDFNKPNRVHFSEYEKAVQYRNTHNVNISWVAHANEPFDAYIEIDGKAFKLEVKIDADISAGISKIELDTCEYFLIDTLLYTKKQLLDIYELDEILRK